MPEFLVYRVESMTGSAHTGKDVPERLGYLGTVEAEDSDAARDAYQGRLGRAPALILPMSLVHGDEAWMLKMPEFP